MNETEQTVIQLIGKLPEDYSKPSKEEMDELLESMGGWFEGTAKESLVTLWKFATSSNSGTLDSILTTENETWEVV